MMLCCIGIKPLLDGSNSPLTSRFCQPTYSSIALMKPQSLPANDCFQNLRSFSVRKTVLKLEIAYLAVTVLHQAFIYLPKCDARQIRQSFDSLRCDDQSA